jgi:hypothetical protein
MAEPADEKRMKLRYAGTCRVCSTPLPAHEEAIYERATKTVRCLGCPASDDGDNPPAPIETIQPEPAVVFGTPGASARREFQRRHAKREDRVRTKHPKLGGLILALSDDPHSTTAWDTGALGEERLGRRLNALACETLLPLHDRRIPGTRANIDHIVVAPSGVYVIDAKKYKGRPSLKIEGGLLRPRTEKLLVGTRDCTKLVDGMHRQLDVVRPIIGDEVPLVGVLCFVEADWPLIGGAFTTRKVKVLWPKKLHSLVAGEGTLHAATIADLHRRLATALPPA